MISHVKSKYIYVSTFILSSLSYVFVLDRTDKWKSWKRSFSEERVCQTW